MNESKTRYWTGILYPESMYMKPENMGDIIQHPYFYGIHNKDKADNGEPLKEHIHLCILFPGPITYKNALSNFEELGQISKVERVKNVLHCWNYFIHDTDQAQKEGKFLYPEENRHTGNGFNIANFNPAEKQNTEKKIIQVIKDYGIEDYLQLYEIATTLYPDEETHAALTGKAYFFNLLLRSNWHMHQNQLNKRNAL